MKLCRCIWNIYYFSKILKEERGTRFYNDEWESSMYLKLTAFAFAFGLVLKGGDSDPYSWYSLFHGGLRRPPRLFLPTVTFHISLRVLTWRARTHTHTFVWVFLLFNFFFKFFFIFWGIQTLANWEIRGGVNSNPRPIL